MKHSRRAAAAGGALMIVLALTGCGTDHTMTAPATPETISAAHTTADVEFAEQMIVHHRGAIEMAELAADRAENPEVEALAAEIEAAQAPEIDTMSAWLQTWGEEVPGSGMDHGDMGGMDHMDMPGMSREQMQQLEQAEGVAFDRMFLEMMTEHHRSAVEMAQTEKTEGENPEAIALAEQIEASQTEEIERMQQLLHSL